MPNATDRDRLYGLLGDLPDRKRPVAGQLIQREDRGEFVLEKLTLDLNGVEPVPAYFLRPHGQGPFPVVLYHHQHAGDYPRGKDELLTGRESMQQPPYATALTAAGYAALCIDTWMFGERSGKSESETFKEMLWNGQVLWGMMIFDAIKAIDYLLTRRDVIPDRIATLGMSLGSTMAWWLAALDPRVKVCVDLCCQTDFQALIDVRGLDGHGLYYFVPSLLKHFTTAQINSLIAPRPHLAVAGNYDRLTPPAGLDRIDAHLKRAYSEAGAPQAWEMFRCNVGHRETAAMRLRIMEFFRKWL